MNISILNCLLTNLNWGLITSIVAVIVSIIALLINRIIAQKNIRLTIQQAIFKIVIDKAKECNVLWESEPEYGKQNYNSPHFKVISELIITIEIIDRSFSLFKKNYKAIKKEHEDDFYYLFWKQLRTDLRGWIRQTPAIAQKLGDQYYSNQVIDIFNKFEKHFEKVL